MKFVKKKWGHEKWIANNDLYCGKELFIRNNKTSSDGKFHFHKIKDETFYIVRGKLVLDYYDNTMVFFKRICLMKGDSFRVEPNVKHRFTGVGLFGCKFMEFSTHHEDSDSYYEVLFPSKIIKNERG